MDALLNSCRFGCLSYLSPMRLCLFILKYVLQYYTIHSTYCTLLLLSKLQNLTEGDASFVLSSFDFVLVCRFVVCLLLLLQSCPYFFLVSYRLRLSFLYLCFCGSSLVLSSLVSFYNDTFLLFSPPYPEDRFFFRCSSRAPIFSSSFVSEC